MDFNIYTGLLWGAALFLLVAIVALTWGRASEAKKYVISALNGVLGYTLGTIIHVIGFSDRGITIGLKVQYVQTLFLVVTLFIIFCSVYNENVGKFSVGVLVVIVLVVTFPVLAATPGGTGVFGWFYGDFSTIDIDGVRFVNLRWTPYRIFFLCMAAMFLVMQFSVFMRACYLSHKNRYKIQHHFFYLAFIPQFIILLDLAFNLYTKRMPLVPAACVVGVIIALAFIKEKKVSNLYDISRIEVFNSLENPLFIIDNRFYVRYANRAAKVLFPEYKSLSEDSFSRKKACSELQNIIVPQIHEVLSPEDDIIRIGNMIFDYDLHRMGSEKSLLGYVITLHDITEETEHGDFLEKQNVALAASLKSLKSRSAAMRDKLISGAIQFVADHDSATAAHMRRVSNYTFVIARELRRMGVYTEILTDSYMETLGQVAPLHDVGKFLVPPDVLKRRDLTEEERSLLKSHTILGMQIVNRMIVSNPDDLFYRLAHEVTLYHHEWWNGTGQPNGLIEVEIPLSARIVAVADVFDSISSRHVARNRYQFEEACGIISEYSGKRFDPSVVAAFNSAKEKLREHYNQMFQNFDKNNDFSESDGAER